MKKHSNGIRTWSYIAISALAAAALVSGCSSDDGNGGVSGSDATGSDAALDDSTAADGVSTDSVAQGDADPSDATDQPDQIEDTVAPPATCAAIADCARNACDKDPSADCAKACLEASDADLAAKAEALASCAQTKCVEGACKGAADPVECLDDCVGPLCTDELAACLDEDDGDGTCIASLGCFDVCSFDDVVDNPWQCLAGCFNKADSASKKLLVGVGKCIGSHFGEDGDPQDKCAVEMTACLISGKTGDQGCDAGFACTDKCDQGDAGMDQVCLAACMQSLTAAAQDQFSAAIACTQEKGNEDPACVDAMLTCLVAGKTGDQGCSSAMNCVGACDDAGGGDGSNMACMSKCLQALTAEAQAQFGELVPCFDSNDDPVCDKKMLLCMSDGKTGVKSCAEGFNCLSECNSGQGEPSPNCMGICYGSMTADAQTQYEAAAPCFGSEEMGSVCLDAMITCSTGGKTGDKACYEAFACAEKCMPGEGDPDLVCLGGCAAELTADSQKQFTAAMMCMGSEEPACADTFTSCAAPSGTATCGATVTCLQGCSGGEGQGPAPSCMFACLHAASAPAAAEVNKVQACYQKCGTDCAADKAPETCKADCEKATCDPLMAACQGGF